MTAADCPAPFAGIVHAHLWPLGIPTEDTSRCDQCGITWAEYRSALET